jgi:hypothetical protein
MSERPSAPNGKTDPGPDAGAAPEPSLLAQVCDIVRYAPIAILLDGPSMLPKLAEQGKVHMGNARFLGRRAVREAEPQVRRLVQGLGQQAGGLLKLAGLVPPGATDDLDGRGDGHEPRPARAPRPAAGAGRGNGSAPAAAPAVETPAADGPDADDLAIPDYESLSASHVVNRLPGLTADELEAVRRYEAAHRGRKTILNKVAQLQAT